MRVEHRTELVREARELLVLRLELSPARVERALEISDHAVVRRPSRSARAGNAGAGAVDSRCSGRCRTALDLLRAVGVHSAIFPCTHPPWGYFGRGMAVLIASNLRKELSGEPLFDGVSFKVERRDRLALVGPERRREDDAAARALRRGSLAGRRARVGEGRARRAPRPAPAGGERRPLREYVLAGTADLAAVEDGAARARARDGRRATHDRATLRRYADAQARLEHAGGYDWRDRAAVRRPRPRLPDDDLDRPLATFSGGELTRASLARALAAQPDLLLLDEPTNHLDIESLEWLEGMLKTIDAAVVLVAHDRWFLEAVTTAVLELEGGRSTYFPGAWHVWRREQEARALHAQKRPSGRRRRSSGSSGSSSASATRPRRRGRRSRSCKQIDRIKARAASSVGRGGRGARSASSS